MTSLQENLEAIEIDIQDLREGVINTLDDRIARLVNSLTGLCKDQNEEIKHLREKLAEYEEEGR